MKEENNGEKIVLVIFGLIITCVILYLLYSVFVSKKSLLSNTYENSVNKDNQSQNNKNLDNTENNNEINSSNKNQPNNETKTNNSTSNNKNTTNTQTTEQKQVKTGDAKVPETPPATQKVPEKKEEVIATYSTTIYDKDANRVSNITLANSKLNGKIIKNGEEFSYNNTIGPMNEQQGFKKALGFDSNGKKIQISGGGLCQVSSTIYNAALIANLNVTERHPHSRRVYYVPKDKDATILYGSLDLKFVNNSGGDIRIDATNDNVTVKITFVKIT